MTIREFELKLQARNPMLSIKQYGTDKVGIHAGNKYICRIMPGDITPYNKFKYHTGKHADAISELNPIGYYKIKLMAGRGRLEAARILYTGGYLKFDDIAKLSI